LTESTWMAHESANNEITPKNLTDASTDLLVEMPSSQDLASSMAQPIAEGRSLTNDPQHVNRVIPAEIPSTPAHNFTNEIVKPQQLVENNVEISEIIQPQYLVEDDLDLEIFDLAAPVSNQDLDVENFWPDPTSGETSPPLYSELDRADNAGYQFQPDLPPAIELDISAPKFSLDPPLNELFPIAIPTESAQSSQPVNQSIEPTDTAHQLDLTDFSDLTDRVESTAIPPNHESSFINLDSKSETAVPTDGAGDLVGQRPAFGNQSPISEAELEELFELEITKGIELVPPADRHYMAQEDALVIEDANDHQLPASMISEDKVAAESTSWNDNLSEQQNGDHSTDLERNDNNSIEPISGIFNYDNYNSFLDLDLNPEVSSNLVDLELNSIEYSADLSSSIDDDLAKLNLNLLDLDGESGSSIDDDLAGLDFLSQSSTELNGFAPNLLDGNNISERDLPNHNSFANLDLNSGAEERDIELSTPIDIATTHASSEIANPSVDMTDEESFGLELADLDLDRLAQTESLDDFADLDLNLFDESDLSSDLTQSANLENLAELNFDEISGGFASDELKDLEGMLDANSSGNLGDVDNLDLLLGTAALGIGGAIAVGSGELDALDDLLGSPAPVNSAETNLDDLDRLLAAPASGAAPVDRASPKKSTTDRRSKQRTFEQTMRVSVRHLDNLNNLVGELVVSRNTLEQDQNRMRQFVEKLLSEVQRLNDVGKRMQDLYERSLMENSLIASRQQSKPTPTPQAQARIEDLEQAGTLMEYDPLEMDRFTPIHMLSQKMIELTVRVRESTADIEFVVDGSTEVTRTLRQITGQLQEDLTKSRMIPFAQTADRLQRGVRDNGLKYGKQVELSVEGRDTLIDKVILESLTDPLIHMVNNAIAHGIEATETRLVAGKHSEGKITIRAIHQGNQTIISIADDGAGISTERVKAKAIEKGIITAQKAATMTKNEVYELLFLPSFSTKDEADELAGRGVGMDVVRTSLTEIRGTITTESQLGVGTTFTIRLPLALSIAKALIAVNNKTNIAFPMDGVEDTQDVSPEQIQLNSNGEQCIFWRDELMPFKPLSDLLGFNRPLPRNNLYDAQENESDLVSILILHSDSNLIAVQVDKIITDREIVIKPLQGPAPKPLGIAGATVMGDGRIVPIADVMELIELAKGNLTRTVSTEWATPMSSTTVEHRESIVLIVDDSITVRELLSLTFKRAGYRVEQARDGQEAWDKLRAGLPCDIVFCDIEMPRMDGLEFLSRVQKDVALSKVPVAMLTSRGSDRHRQIAAQLGASGYFIKPYLEEALLDAAKRMIKGEVLAIV
ncbi:MAG: hypothetical protein RLZZ135_752, partial [Cyanobacteriota bacterium]